MTAEIVPPPSVPEPQPPASFWRKYWYHFAYLLLIIVALATGLYLGRGPERVRVEEKEKIVYKDKIVEVVKEVEAKAKDEVKKEQVHRVTTIVQTPDAGTTTTIVEDSGTETRTQEMEVRFVDRIMERLITEERWLEKKVTVDGKKSVVIISALAMMDLSQAISQGLSQGFPTSSLAGGLLVQFRIFGPLWGGVLGTVGPGRNTPIPQGYVGVTLGLEF